MSSPKRNLTMLSDYLLGDMISEHDGVRCYPAIRRGTEEKYIVKVISIPSSPTRLDALLLTGALSGKEAALEYFMELAQDVLDQTDILRRLSHQEGFVPYLDGKITPIEGEVGYDVYLLGTYKHSLERMLSTDVMTHIGAINMGLDLCAALAACRRTGYLYVDLKPENIFYDPEQGCRIGDVGFIALSSLKYASLPDKYRSSYSAPELADDFAVINTTVDVFALGLVMYQVYNGGTLPFEGAAPEEILPPPLYADYEMAQIIAKACHPDPAQRYQEPTQMAQALIGYMQSYGASEEPIIPPVMEMPVQEQPAEEIEEFLPEMDAEQLQQEMEALENAQPEELAFMSALVNDETAPSEETAADVSEEVLTEEITEMLAQADELIAYELPEPPVAPDPIEVPVPEPIVLELEAEIPEEIGEETIPEETPEAEITETVTEEPDEPLTSTAEEEADPEVAVEEVTSEDAAPEEIVAEEIVTEEAPQAAAEETVTEALTEESPEVPEVPEKQTRKEPEVAEILIPANPIPAQPKTPFRFPWKIAAAALLILALIGLYCYGSYYYQNLYKFNVDSLKLNNVEDKLTVQLVCDADESLLRVVCTDIYGNSLESAVIGGIATFEQLNPNTRYTVRVEISGTHKLTGSTTESFTTPAQTQVLSFIAGMGPEDCSVALSFIVDGPQSDSWIVSYGAEGVETKSLTFTGHNVVIRDLQEGARYTFTLSSPDGLYMSGQTQVTCTATNILAAQDLTITACGGGSLTVEWLQPENGMVEEWSVRCFNNVGYNTTIVTSDLSYTFTGLDHSHAYTVEVTAVGMDRSVNASVPANPLTIENFQCQFTENRVLHISWDCAAGTPEGGWVLQYSIGDGAQLSLTLQEPAADLIALPGGEYQFTIEAADGSYLFGASQSYTADTIPVFSGFGLTIPDMIFQMCLWPEGDNWQVADIPEENYGNSYILGDQTGFIVTLAAEPEDTENLLNIQFVLHDASGTLVHSSAVEMAWNSLWLDGYGRLPIPVMPEVGGTYTLSVYFDGCFVFLQEFSIA